MQVKKFEAKTMREALVMVKSELGPDAIILSAKDIKRGYGLAGGAGVELTAAISDTKFRERQFALRKLKEEEKARFQNSPARVQKNFIEKSLQQYLEEREQATKASAITARRQYIHINDEEDVLAATTTKNTAVVKKASVAEDNAVRVKSAVYTAAKAFNQDFKEKKPKVVTKNPITAASVSNVVQANTRSVEVEHLRSEIQRLNSVIENFHKMPQSFAGTHPGADYGLPFELSFMFEKLTETGINRDLVGQILEKAKEAMSPIQMKKKALVEAWAAKYILDSIKVSGEKSTAKIEVFIGGSGAGKTSSLVKDASYQLIVKRKSVAIISTDTNKVGAVDQLKIYAQILNVPFAAVRSTEEWDIVLKRLSGIDVILVDTPGVSLKDLSEIDTVKSNLQHIQGMSRIHYVLSAASNESAAMELAKRFRMFRYHDLIFTKLDECANHGLIYSMSERLDCPMHSFGIGAQIPEDYEFATRERVLDLIFKITKKG